MRVQVLAMRCIFGEPQIPGKVRENGGCWEDRNRIMMCLVLKLEFYLVGNTMSCMVFQVRRQSGQRALNHSALCVSVGPLASFCPCSHLQPDLLRLLSWLADILPE